MAISDGEHSNVAIFNGEHSNVLALSELSFSLKLTDLLLISKNYIAMCSEEVSLVCFLCPLMIYLQ